MMVQDREASDVLAYMASPIDRSLLPEKVAIGVSSKGNFFMTEIARIIEDGFRALGVATRFFTEEQASSITGYDAVMVVAPHEFFLLGSGPIALQVLRKVPNLIMFNTEQRQTQWFGVAEKYLRSAAAVLDINFETASYLASRGYTASFLPLGYSEYMERTFTGDKLPHHELFAYMPASVREAPPASYDQRPIDILFIGTSSPRRQEFFARHASYFATTNSFIYLPDGSTPFLPTQSRTIGFGAFVALAKRSKILLNIHRDETPFLEWQRIVTLGILQRVLVISDISEPNPCVEPQADYLEATLDSIPQLCESTLRDLSAAETLADCAYDKFRQHYPMQQVLGRWYTAYAATLGK